MKSAFSCLIHLHCSRRGEVVLLLSSENKFYVLLIGVTGDGSGRVMKSLQEAYISLILLLIMITWEISSAVFPA